MFLGHETRRTVLVVRIVDNGSGLVIGVLTKSGGAEFVEFRLLAEKCPVLAGKMTNRLNSDTPSTTPNHKKTTLRTRSNTRTRKVVQLTKQLF
ncbi:hypothetical protein FIU87_03745 [Bacillus sp. THAF10]|nr:hypothetical protein FIU87_03745 [Bacillus sp. THAF10]